MTLTLEEFTVGRVSVPDSKLAREITELVRDTESPCYSTIRVASFTGAHWPARSEASHSIPSSSIAAACSTIWA